jgi:hypothetical protein
MTATPQTFSISVTSAASVPSSGQVVLTGTNTQASLMPSGFFQAQWIEVLNGDFGAGVFVPGYGAKGAYVVNGVSGDASPLVFDAVIFDFDSRTWTLQANAHGIPNSPVKGPVSATSGSPYYEMTGYTQVPHPHQPYRIPVGVGSRVIRPVGSCMTSTPLGTLWSHQYDTATRLYSRLSTNAMTPNESNWMIEACCLYDATANRIWFIDNELAYINRLPYLDLNDNTWKSSASFTAPSGGPINPNWPHAILHDDGTRRCILVFKTPLYGGTSYPTYASVLDLNNIAAGFTSVTLTGPLAQFNGVAYGITGSFTQAQTSRWAQYPSDNCHYAYDGNSGLITKLTPPASGITGTWTASTITPPTAFPAIQRGSGTCCHYTRFFYVPALDCFAWVAGGTAQVALWKP